MTFPEGAYIYEFLYRGQPSGSDKQPAYHVIIAVPGTDSLGNPTLAMSPAMTPDQAVSGGLDLPTLIGGINTATTGQATTLQSALAAAQAQSASLQTQLTAAQAQVAQLQSRVTALTPIASVSGLTFLEFQDLFTGDEETAIMTAAQSTPALMLWLLKAAGAQFIDLSDPQTKAGLDALVAVGVITADREAVILAGTPPS